MTAIENIPTVPGVEPLLPSCDTAIAQILLSKELIFYPQPAPSPEASGEVLLNACDFTKVDNAHLASLHVRFAMEVPYGAEDIEQRLLHMFHAGISHPAAEIRAPAFEAHDVIFDQLLGVDTTMEEISERAAEAQQLHPEVIAAGLRLDLAKAPDLIDKAVRLGADESELVAATAPIFVIAAAFQIQREGSLGNRLRRYPMNGRVPTDGKRIWTIGQVFSPYTKKHKFAAELMALYEKNRAAGVTKVTDGRVIGRVRRMAKKFGMTGIEPANDEAICDVFAEAGAPDVGVLLHRHRPAADAAACHFRNILGNQREGGAAGRHMDALSAPISAVERLAIVCARAFEVAKLARTATTTADLRAMLETRLPQVLCGQAINRRDEEAAEFRLLFHAARVAFLLDGRHLPKLRKGSGGTAAATLELPTADYRRGRDTMKDCHDYLSRLPQGWRFTSWFGWEHEHLVLEEWHVREAA